MKRISVYVAIVILVLLAGTGVWLYYSGYFDCDKPDIRLVTDITAIGKHKDIDVVFSDKTSGLSRVKVEIAQDNKSRLLTEQSFPSRGLRQKVLRLQVNTDDLKLKTGPAMMIITVDDHSLFNNENSMTQQIKIDKIPPRISVLNPSNYLNPGGAGFIAYRVSKPSALTGIYVDQQFYNAYTISINGRPTTVAYFAVPLNALHAKTKINIYARDEAGNESQVPLPFVIKPKKFRTDKVNLGDTFLQKSMPEFEAMVPSLQGKNLTEIFEYVNTRMREENSQTIQKLCGKSVNRKLWDGAFHRMRNAKPMALFGDQRTYLVGGKPFGNSVHMGIDLASVAHAPIEAANNGIVIYAAPLGIYGNTVIIDHGLGLFSLYGHLSTIETTVGKNVQKGEKLGLSGLTGLAGGDHLHFSILISGQFVNPQEWWDAHWIEDNILKKMAI